MARMWGPKPPAGHFRTLGLITIITFLAWANGTAPGAILHVAKSGDGSDGLTWATAYQTISAALVHSASGDAVWIAGGTYNENIVVATSVALYGGFAGTEADDEFNRRNASQFLTVVDATGTQNRAISIRSNVILDGLTITGGEAAFGGGVHCYASDVIIRDCTIMRNRAFSGRTDLGWDAAGAGIYAGSSSLFMERVIVSINILEGVEISGSQISGAGIHAVTSSISMEDCVISKNLSHHAEAHYGCGLALEHGKLVAESCDFSENDNAGNRLYYTPFFQQSGAGSALHLYSSTAEITDTTFTHNIERSALSSYTVTCSFGYLLLDRCTFLDNISTQENALKLELRIDTSTASIRNSLFIGGPRPTMYLPNSVMRAEFCTFARNTNISKHYNYVFQIGNTNLFVDGCIVWDNQIGQLIFDSGQSIVHVSHSNIELPTQGSGNISADPLFVNPSVGDFRLQLGSPCIDTASESGPSVDIAGRPRPIDLLGAGRDGPGAFDMGAYEFQLAPADFNKDGAVDAKDLLIFQEYWNETAYEPGG